MRYYALYIFTDTDNDDVPPYARIAWCEKRSRQHAIIYFSMEARHGETWVMLSAACLSRLSVDINASLLKGKYAQRRTT